MRIELLDRSGGRVAPASFRPFLRRLAAFLEPPDGDLTILFCEDAEIARLNREWRGKRGPTDVLSFPGTGATPDGRVHIGDLVVSVDTARRSARRGGRPLAREIETLLSHGLLHLLGFDHETDDGTMLRLQGRALAHARSADRARGRC
jgi:probable rRNA maturation factor